MFIKDPFYIIISNRLHSMTYGVTSLLDNLSVYVQLKNDFYFHNKIIQQYFKTLTKIYSVTFINFREYKIIMWFYRWVLCTILAPKLLFIHVLICQLKSVRLANCISRFNISYIYISFSCLWWIQRSKIAWFGTRMCDVHESGLLEFR